MSTEREIEYEPIKNCKGCGISINTEHDAFQMITDLDYKCKWC